MERKDYIYILDEDKGLLDNLERAIGKNFEEAFILKFSSIKECYQAFKRNRPILMILSISYEKIWQLIDEAQKDTRSTSKVPTILIGTRKEITDHSQKIDAREIPAVPKAIRIPFLIETIEESIRKANLTDMKLRELLSRERLFSEGDESDSIFVVKSGEIRIFKVEESKEVTIASLGAGQLIGEMSFIDHLPRSASAEATEPSKVLEIMLKDFDSYLETQPFWLRLILDTLLVRLRESNEKIKNLSKED